MRVTLKTFGSFSEKSLTERPRTLTEAMEQNEAAYSLVDTGVPEDLREIANMDKISFGHFILIEQLLGLDIDNDAKLLRVMPYVLRPAEENKLDNENEEEEAKHKERVLNLDYGAALGAFNRFMKVRKEYLYKRYNGVIYATQTDDEDDDKSSDDDDGDTVADGAVTAREFHNKKFFWYALVGSICGGDIFRRADALELMMYEVMPFLAEKRSLAIVEALEQKSRRK